MDTTPATNHPLYLRALLDGIPVDFGIVAAAVRDGEIEDLSRVEVTLERRPYLSKPAVPAREHQTGHSPVGSEIVRKDTA